MRTHPGLRLDPPARHRWLIAGIMAIAGCAMAFYPRALADDATDATRERAPWVPTGPERARIVSFGPWPPSAAMARDRAIVSSADAVDLGERLFNSARLSGDGRLRCASCHEPWRRFSDGRAHASGRVEGARNTPSLLDVALHRTLGWDGTFDRLDAQSLRPLRDADEMASPPSHVAALIREDGTLRARYESAFGAAPTSSDEAVFEDAGRALAAYETTLVSDRTDFDALRDAFAATVTATATNAAAALGGPGPNVTASAWRGLRLFIGRAGCSDCHAGPGFSDDALHVSTTRSLRVDGTPDVGRATGPAYAFRTPSLRGVAATAPYMHDGHVERLCDAVRPHALPDGADVVPAGARALDAGDRDDLVAFLRMLGDAPPVGDSRDSGKSCRD